MKVYVIMSSGAVYDTNFHFKHLESIYTTKEKAEAEAEKMQEKYGLSIIFTVEEYELKE